MVGCTMVNITYQTSHLTPKYVVVCCSARSADVKGETKRRTILCLIVLGSVVKVSCSIYSTEYFLTWFPEDGDDTSVFLCPSGFCHTLISHTVRDRGNLSIRRACYEQNRRPEELQQPREYIWYFLCFFVLNCRQVLGPEE